MEEKRLINANALTDLEALEYNYHPVPDGEAWYRAADVWDCIDNAPTVDAVEVIRCRDCKYYGSTYPKAIPPTCHNRNGLLIPDELEFCSRAERRE